MTWPDIVAEKKQRLDQLRPYTSNAIEGNTLSAVETTLVIEQGVTIGGKPLKDHQEALDHYDAIRYVRELARAESPLTESHVRTETGRFEFPSPAEIPALMGDFAKWLGATADTPDMAFTAHRRLVAIHPFNDGNGRAARLLMNLILIRAGYPPIAVRPEDRPAYILALQQSQFDTLLYMRLDATLGEYVEALQPSPPHR
jgi:Fic family protein